MAECTVASNSAPELPLVVLTKMASMLQRNETEGSQFKDRLQLAAVSRQHRQAVLSSIQQMKRRHMKIEINQFGVIVAAIIVKNKLRSSYSHMDCIDALLAFAQPNSLYLSEYAGNLSHSLILMLALPLSLTSLVLQLSVGDLGVNSPLDHLLKAVASKTNLQTLSIYVYCLDESVRVAHLKSSPSVPKNSPFNHLLTLENVRTLYFNSNSKFNRLLSPAQIADLMNRWQSKITHICCQHYDHREREQLFEGVSDIVRCNIVSICCVYVSSLLADELRFLDRLPSCTTIHFPYGSYVTQQQFNEFGGRLLDVCCTDDVHSGRRLECSIGCYGDLEEYLGGGGETQIEYARNDTVVRLSIGTLEMMRYKHCPFTNNPHNNL